MTPVRTRFAPSPTGHLHVGGARTAIFNWLFARRHGGEMILRIEDTDQERSTRESEKVVLDDLRWLGLEWSEGPDSGGPHGPYRQSERLERYREVGGLLLESGAAYRCFCEESDLERKKEFARSEGRPPHYDLTCYRLSKDESDAKAEEDGFVIRFHVDRPDEQSSAAGDVEIDDLVRGSVAWKHESLGDFIVIRRDGMPTYNFAVVVDDHDMEISHVIRGEEHLTNTHRQVLLYRALGWSLPDFAHVSLILGEDRTKLSKRHGASSLGAFAESGILPEALANYLILLGWSHPEGVEMFSMAEAAELFSFERVSPSPAVFDRAKLEWLNGEYLEAIPSDELFTKLRPVLEQREWLAGDFAAASEWFIEAIALVRAGARTLDEITDALGFFFGWDAREVLTNPEIAEVLGDETSRRVLHALSDDLAAHGSPRTEQEFAAMSGRVKESSGAKGKSLFMPLRMALTGQAHGPELKSAVPLLARGAEIDGVPDIEPLHARVHQLIELGSFERPSPTS